MEVPVLILHYEKYETNATTATLLYGFVLDRDISSDCDSLSSHHDALDLNALPAHLPDKPLDSLSANHGSSMSSIYSKEYIS
eukprot:5052742-Ditylum_brightwellii.AAC.1